MTIAQERSEEKVTDQHDHITTDQEDRMVVIVFNIPRKDAQRLYSIASNMNTTTSSLIRSILYGNTNNLTNFDSISPDPYPSNKTGRPIKRFIDE